MADNIVGGLFGIDPTALKQQQQATMSNNAFKYANLNPAEQAQYGAYVAGGLGGQAAQGLLGIEDPQLQKARIAQQLASQFDTTSPEGLRKYADALAQNGAPDLAQMAVQRASQLEKTASEVTKNLREKQIPTSGLGKLIFERDELLKAGVPTNDPNVVAYNKAIEAEGKGKGTSITVDQRGQTEFAKGLGAEDAKRVNNAEKLIESAAGTLGTLKQMAEKDALGVVSGTGAGARVEALKFLDTAGITTPAEKTKLANSENFNKLTGDLVLERIKMLGTNPSNADRDFIKAIVPQLESSAVARKQLITYMANRANQVITEASTLSSYGRKNQGLSGYKPTIPLVDITPSNRDISSYSVKELEEMAKNAKPAGAK